MRTIGRLNDERQAATLVDYLFTLGVGAKAERNERPGEATTWELWVFDEDQLATARESLEAFRGNPTEERFTSATKAADKLRREAVDREFEVRRKEREVQRKAFPSNSGRRPITMTLLLLSVLVFILTDGGAIRGEGSLVSRLSITAITPIGDGVIRYQKGLPEIQDYQLWRLVSPIFLHFDVFHIFFDMWLLVTFGTQIEMRSGSLKLLFFAILFAAAGNFVQYYFEGPRFGGMSGVVYGLFGFIWMKSYFQPESNYEINSWTVIILVLWFMLGVLGGVLPTGNAANYCHAVGLMLGIACGYSATFLRTMRKRA